MVPGWFRAWNGRSGKVRLGISLIRNKNIKYCPNIKA